MKDQVTLDNTIGAVFLGALASCLLFGITIVQTHLYYHNFSEDWKFQKISVAVLMVLATFHLIFMLHAVYFYLVVNFGNLAALESIVWSLKLQLLINSFTALSVQSLYAMRVWKLGRQFSRFWPGLVAFIVAGGWAVGNFAVVKSYNQKYFTDLDAVKKVLYAAPGIATGIDVILATALCYYLNRSRTSFIGGTNNKILTIMRYVLVTGFLTSACSLSTLIAYATMPYNLVFAGIDLLLPNLYINSYLSMLNARKSMSERGAFYADVSKGLTTLRADDGNLDSVNYKMGAGAVPLSTTRFISSKRASDPQGKRATHRTDERHSYVFPLWMSRGSQMCNTSEHGRQEQPAGDCNTCDLVANV